MGGAGLGRSQNPQVGAGQRSNAPGAGQKDRKPISRCQGQCLFTKCVFFVLFVIQHLVQLISVNIDLAGSFLGALASLKTMLKIKLVTNVYKIIGFQEYCKVFQNITDSYRVLQSVTEYYRVLQSITEYYRVLQSITEYYSVAEYYR